MEQNALKKLAGEAAIEFIKNGMIVGVGTGSTTNYFIDALANVKSKIEGAVASSIETAKRLKTVGIPVFDLNAVDEVSIYVDGADEVNDNLHMIKGGGGALTGEKIIAATAKQFICIADFSKKVDTLGRYPLPIEVIPMARGYVARALVKMGGNPVYRDGFVSDYGNIILDTQNLDFTNPILLEETLNQITGVVTNGLFAKRPADILLLATEQGVEKITL